MMTPRIVLALVTVLTLLSGCLGSDLSTSSGTDENATTVITGTDDDTPWAGQPPIVYFVVHADPATGPELRWRWDNLVQFMNDLTARRQARGVTHHVTIMFTPEWGKLIAEQSPDGIERRKLIASWIAAGHEMAFHSHTHNHTFRDGYTNAPQFGDDRDDDGEDRCSGDRTAGECTLDYGLMLVRDAIRMAVPGYDLHFGALGPRGNGGEAQRWGQQDNRCDPEYIDGLPQADTDHCIQAEWSETLDQELEYTGLGFDQDAPLAATEALGQSVCVRYGAATTDIYSIPFAPFETEAGQPRMLVDTMREAINMGDARHLIGTVMHPMSYTGPATEVVARLFDFLDGAATDATNRWGTLASVSMSEARVRDLYGPGVVCKDYR